MNSGCESGRRTWLARNRVTVIAASAIVAYAIFVESVWGWQHLLAQWTKIGLGHGVAALALLVATYFIRGYRIYDYFPMETAGRFLALFRVTQVHNLLNIMLPFRTGETSFPLLMRSEFSIPLARGTSALLVMRLLDLHALLTVAALGLVLAHGSGAVWALWAAALVAPLPVFLLKDRVVALARRLLPAKLDHIVEELNAGLPATTGAFLRAWAMTILNWAVKVLVLAWVLAIMGVAPLAACFGGALGGELSSVLPMHAPAGVGTYPAAIAAGAVSFGAGTDRATLAQLAGAGVNAHLLIIVSAVAGTMLSMFLNRRP